MQAVLGVRVIGRDTTFEANKEGILEMLHALQRLQILDNNGIELVDTGVVLDFDVCALRFRVSLVLLP